MKKIFKTTVLFVSVFALSVMAQQDTQSLKDKAQGLREQHQELKVQVDAGILTKEDARATWQELIEIFRAEKDSYIKERVQKVKQRYDAVSENNPERAELIKQRMGAFEKRRIERKEKHEDIKVKIKSGELSRKDAIEIKQEFRKSQSDVIKDSFRALKQQDLQLQRDQKGETLEVRAERREVFEGNKGERKGDFQEKRREQKSVIQEHKNEFQDKREKEKNIVQQRFEDRKSFKGEGRGDATIQIEDFREQGVDSTQRRNDAIGNVRKDYKTKVEVRNDTFRGDLNERNKYKGRKKDF